MFLVAGSPQVTCVVRTCVGTDGLLCRSGVLGSGHENLDGPSSAISLAHACVRGKMCIRCIAKYITFDAFRAPVQVSRQGGKIESKQSRAVPTLQPANVQERYAVIADVVRRTRADIHLRARPPCRSKSGSHGTCRD